MTRVLSKKDYISLHFNHIGYRLPVFIICLILIFCRIELQFMILVSIGIPHVLFGLWRDYKSRVIAKSKFQISLVINIILATLLCLLSKDIFIYVVFFRFVLHFFEDDHFNHGLKNPILGLALTFLFFSMDFFHSNHTAIITFSIIVTLASMLLLNTKKTTEKFTNFYFMYSLFILIPIIFRLYSNSSSWSFNIAIIHSVLWIIYDCHSGNIFRPHKSLALILSIAFLVINSLSIYFDLLSFQQFYQIFFYAFYFMSFIHVFSRDQVLILQKIQKSYRHLKKRRNS